MQQGPSLRKDDTHRGVMTHNRGSKWLKGGKECDSVICHKFQSVVVVQAFYEPVHPTKRR